MASFNRVILAGNLTRDPQLSYTPSNTPVCEFGMALNRRSRDKDGNQRDEVCFIDVTAYSRTAEMISQYFQKGRSILIEGRLRYREWTSKEGQKRNKLDVIVENFSFIDSGAGGGNRGPGGGGPPMRGGQNAGAAGGSDMPPPPDDMPPPGDPEVPF